MKLPPTHTIDGSEDPTVHIPSHLREYGYECLAHGDYIGPEDDPGCPECSWQEEDWEVRNDRRSRGTGAQILLLTAEVSVLQDPPDPDEFRREVRRLFGSPGKLATALLGLREAQVPIIKAVFEAMRPREHYTSEDVCWEFDDDGAPHVAAELLRWCGRKK